MKKISYLALLLMLGVTPFLTSCGPSKEAAYVNIKGSDTIVHVASSIAESYMNDNPDASVSVTGGGTGTGIAALLNGTADIANASRRIKSKETDLAAQKGIKINEIAVARDGIAIIVNAKNPVNELTMDQLSNIYRGKVKSWKQVGGHDSTFNLLSRESSSGTYSFIQKTVLGKKDFAKTAKLMPATSAIITEVASSKDAIGYVGLGYAQEAKGKVKILKIKANKKAKAILPTDETVKNGSYAISRPLFMYSDANAPASAKDFLDYVLSEKGQEVVKEEGFVKIN